MFSLRYDVWGIFLGNLNGFGMVSSNGYSLYSKKSQRILLVDEIINEVVRPDEILELIENERIIFMWFN